jgi:hypothetical protein
MEAKIIVLLAFPTLLQSQFFIRRVHYPSLTQQAIYYSIIGNLIRLHQIKNVAVADKQL